MTIPLTLLKAEVLSGPCHDVVALVIDLEFPIWECGSRELRASIDTKKGWGWWYCVDVLKITPEPPIVGEIPTERPKSWCDNLADHYGSDQSFVPDMMATSFEGGKYHSWDRRDSHEVAPPGKRGSRCGMAIETQAALSKKQFIHRSDVPSGMFCRHCHRRMKKS